MSRGCGPEHRGRKETTKSTINDSVVSSWKTPCCVAQSPAAAKPVKTRRSALVMGGPPARADM